MKAGLMIRTASIVLTVLSSCCLAGSDSLFALEPERATRFSSVLRDDRIEIELDGRPATHFMFKDAKILRPYFANLRSGDVQLTRNHPPVAGQDAVDHDTMHPGIWMAFGDINGEDFWRNKGAIRHIGFDEGPRAEADRLSFAIRSQLVTSSGRTIGEIVSRITLIARPAGWMLVWKADFSPQGEALVFGDQEEMGFGVRVATKITEKSGGRILSSTGAVSAKETWGKTAAWCDTQGRIEGRDQANLCGVLLMASEMNFRSSWWHNRDYGLMVANPFGREAMNQGEQSRYEVKVGERLSLTFGAMLHSGREIDPQAEFAVFSSQ
ncbi:MAG: DUF6807 family protein [Pirellulales bacterium]